MMLEIQVLSWDRHKNVVGSNQLMGSQPSPLDNRIFINHFNFQTRNHFPFLVFGNWQRHLIQCFWGMQLWKKWQFSIIAILVIFSILKWCNLYHALLQAPIFLISPHFFTGRTWLQTKTFFYKTGPTFIYLSSYLSTLLLHLHWLLPTAIPKN